jgi:hypothetical protein
MVVHITQHGGVWVDYVYDSHAVNHSSIPARTSTHMLKRVNKFWIFNLFFFTFTKKKIIE